jgi:hypothetical protein
MMARLFILALAFASPCSRAQVADLGVVAFASPAARLAAGEEFTVSVTVQNHGPAAATPSVSIGLGSNVAFYFEFLASLNPACGEAQMLDYSPPAFVIDWSPAALPAGEQITCSARLRVRFLQADFETLFFAGTSVSPPIIDPAQQNNLTSFLVGFRTRMRTQAIPALNEWACGFTIAVVLLGGLALPRNFACGGSRASRY